MLLDGGRAIRVKSDGHSLARPTVTETLVSIGKFSKEACRTNEVSPRERCCITRPLYGIALHSGRPDEHKIINAARIQIGEADSLKLGLSFGKVFPQKVEDPVCCDLVLIPVSPPRPVLSIYSSARTELD